MNTNTDYKEKYLKYKIKYLELKAELDNEEIFVKNVNYPDLFGILMYNYNFTNKHFEKLKEISTKINKIRERYPYTTSILSNNDRDNLIKHKNQKNYLLKLIYFTEKETRQTILKLKGLRLNQSLIMEVLKMEHKINSQFFNLEKLKETLDNDFATFRKFGNSYGI